MQKKKENEALKILETYKGLIYAVRLRQKRAAKLVAATAPSAKVTMSYELREGSFSPSHSEAMADLEAMVVNRMQLADGMEKLDMIETALAMLPEDERLFLVMYCIDNIPISTITGALNYSSRQSVYNLQQRAAKHFSQIMCCRLCGLDKM